MITFNEIKKSTDTAQKLKFCIQITAEHSEDALEYHYSLLKHDDIDPGLYKSLRTFFSKHGPAGELFLQQKYLDETDSIIKGQVLQILGGYYRKPNNAINVTRRFALEGRLDEDSFIRNRAVIVLGWVGQDSDISEIAHTLENEADTETRGWAASALMQLFFRYKDNQAVKNRIMRVLNRAVISEADCIVLNCILVAIQEVSGIKLGLSSTAHKTPSAKKLEKAKAAYVALV